MNETFEMKDGTVVEFYSGLSYNGINISVNTKLTELQKEKFRSEIKQERDVVSIKYNK